MIVSIETPIATAVELLVESQGTAARTIQSTTESEFHEFTVVGLRAETEYRFTATAGDETLTTAATTGSLPTAVPPVQVLQEARGTSNDGITIVGRRPTDRASETGPVYFGFDSEGHIVWYLPQQDTVPEGEILRDLGDGHIVASVNGGHEVLTVDGESLSSYGPYDTSWGLHHDCLLYTSPSPRDQRGSRMPSSA